MTRKMRRLGSSLLLLILLFFSGAHQGRSFQADNRVEIYNLRYHTHPSFTRIVVDIGKVREYTSSQLSDPDRIYVDIFQTKLNPILQGKAISVQNGYIGQIRIAQKTEATARIVVDLDFSQVKEYTVFPLHDPFRIVIDISPSSPSEIPDVPPVGQPAQPTKEGYSMVRQLGLGIQRIVIDPGHGGRDPGCVGKKGTLEKDIVLDVCERLKNLLLQNKGLEVILTRETDIFVPVENRVVIANQRRADIFISVHANSWSNRKRAGIETFFLNFSQDPNVLKIAAIENATTTKSISQQREILEKIIQTNKLIESRELASQIQGNLVKSLSSKYNEVNNLGAKGGPFWVLIGGEMPSILVEISHLSNALEEDRLTNPQYRQQVAQGIFDGITKYMQSLGKG